MWNKKAISFLVVLIPLIGSYRSIIQSVDSGTLIFLLFSIAIILSDKKITITSSPMTAIIIYILLVSPIVLLFFNTYQIQNSSTVTEAFLRWAKFILVLIITFTLGIGKYFEIKLAMKCMRVIIYISTIFVIIQHLAYLSGRIINNPLLNLATYEGYTYGKYSMLSTLFRPSAMFLEPSHMSQYFLVYLIYSLFRPKINKRDIIDAIVTSVGILCTGSGIGVVALIALVLFFIVICFSKNPVKALLPAILILVCGCILFQTTYMQAVVSRFLTDNTAGGGNALFGRIGSGYILFSSLPFGLQLFGRGFGNTPTNIYLNGITYLLNTIGIFGCGIFVSICIYIYIRVNFWRKILLLCFISLLFVAQMFTAFSLVLYFLLLTAPQENVSSDQNIDIVKATGSKHAINYAYKIL